MSYTPTIYDWRTSVIPASQIFVAGGQSVIGGFTIGGALSESPEPGGRAMLDVSFNAMKTASNVDASWTMSRILGGSIMCVPIVSSPQLVPAADLDGAEFDLGVPWGNDQPWGNGENWAYDPSSIVTEIALAGSASFKADLSGYGEVLTVGHVIGFKSGSYHFAHVVMNISYSAASVATVQVSPPLRRDLAVGAEMMFRPKFMGVARDASSFKSAYTPAGVVQPGRVEFIEALV